MTWVSRYRELEAQRTEVTREVNVAEVSGVDATLLRKKRAELNRAITELLEQRGSPPP